jgi:uncharacterized integral membrane protein (TIGR00698 family)
VLGRNLIPGLGIVAILTVLATVLASIPGIKILGALGLALIVGMMVRISFGLPAPLKPGVGYAAKTVLRLGIVLLGVRLDFAKLLESGALILGLDILMVAAGIVIVERLGKWFGLSRGLRLALAFGTGVCGASAAVAAGSIANAQDEEVSVAVGTVSVLGTFGVIGFILTKHFFGFSSQHYGILTGASLQEVGQVIAANPVGSSELDFATLTKLARVALLAPALFVASSILRSRQSSHINTSDLRPPLFPQFLLGFLGVGLINSLGLFPKELSNLVQQISIYLTTAAMIGIGLGVDFRVVRQVGARALLLGLIGFAVLIVLGVVYLGVFLRT